MEPSHLSHDPSLVGRTAESSGPPRPFAEVPSNETATPSATTSKPPTTGFEARRLLSFSTRNQHKDTTSSGHGPATPRPQEQAFRTISWNLPDSNVIHQPRPRRHLPSLSLLDRQARCISNQQSMPDSPNRQPQPSHAGIMRRTDTIYRQSNKSYASLMNSWTRKLDRDAGKDHQRSRSVLGLTSFRSASQERRAAPERPASAGHRVPDNKQAAPRVRPLRRFSWQKGHVAKSDGGDGEWRHNEGPLVLVSNDHPSVTGYEGVTEPESQDSDSDDESITTVIHRPVSSESLPFRPQGYSGKLPRFYPIALKMSTLPSPPPALAVLFPGDEVEQVRAQVAQARLELAEREEELAKTKKEMAEEEEAAKKAKKEMKKVVEQARKCEERMRQLKEENRALRQAMGVKNAEVEEEQEGEKWWNW